MKNTAVALLVAVCGSAACQRIENVHVPTAPSVSEETVEPVPLPNPAYPDNGEELVEYIIRKYPERLAATETYQERVRNMEFVRDRMVEAGICGGMDLARNLKRGVGPFSVDAIAWRPDGEKVEVVDIAASWDSHRGPLRLQWLIVGGPPGWSPVTRPTC